MAVVGVVREGACGGGSCVVESWWWLVVWLGLTWRDARASGVWWLLVVSWWAGVVRLRAPVESNVGRVQRGVVAAVVIGL